MSVNRLFLPDDTPPLESANESPQDKLARMIGQLPEGQRRRFYVDFHAALRMAGQVVVELAPAGPRVIDPRRILVAHRGPPLEVEA